VGDAAWWYHEGLGTGLRLENRTNAVEQGMLVAGNILGKDRPYTPVPFFWTDQFEDKIQVHGFLPAHAEVAIVEGDPAQRKFVAVYGSHDKVTGVLGWNMMKEARQYRQRVVDGAAFSSTVAGANASPSVAQ
jgi:NADPH-dependent 2,4-dienoyl-CoA reductase/sulfur reductase-like enzyme